MSEFEFNFSKGFRGMKKFVSDVRKARQRGRLEVGPDGFIKAAGMDGFVIGGNFKTKIFRHRAVQELIDSGDVSKLAWTRDWVRSSGLLARMDGFELVDASVDPNLVPDLGINHVLDVIFGSGTKVTTWYQGPFTTDWTPVAAAASDWGKVAGGLATELADAQYDESARQSATFGSAAAAKNIATSAATTFTLATGESGVALYGSTLNSVATVAYTGTDEILIAATRFGTAKTGLGAADVININYDITGSSS